MTYNAEQITFMLAEAIDQDREYKSWHVSTKHLMTLAEKVRNDTLEEVALEFEKMKVFEADTMASIAVNIRDMKA